MLNPNQISKYNSLSAKQRLALEKQMQQDDLSYLSSIAFEQFNVTNSDIDKINLLIDKKSGRNYTYFTTILISVLCGLLLGISVFFIIFQKSKNHPSVFQSLKEEQGLKKLNNTITNTDTIFPIIETKPIEHYNIITNLSEPAIKVEEPEIMPSKQLNLSIAEAEDNEDLVYAFTPNAPVVFISNLKVTNYRLYYFKQSEAINLSINVGLSAQYGSNADVERATLNKSNTYLAHKIIKQAMRLFSSKNLVNCIEELTLLYNYNKDDANAQFYLGMCYFQLGKYAIAQTYFQKNIDNINNVFHQESEFYQALCLLNTKQMDKAIPQLQTIINNKGFYSLRAKEVLDKQFK